MSNCCRIYVKADLATTLDLVKDIPSVLRFDNNLALNVVPVSKSYYGKVPHKVNTDEFTEVNYIDYINIDIFKHLQPFIIWQDLDAYGIDRFFKYTFEGS